MSHVTPPAVPPAVLPDWGAPRPARTSRPSLSHLSLVLILLAGLALAACRRSVASSANPAEAGAATPAVAAPTESASAPVEPTPPAPPETTATPAQPAQPARSGPRATGEIGAPLEAPPLSDEPVPTPDVQILPPDTPAVQSSAASAAPRVRTIAIDPGHGGPETGAVTGRVTEAQLNLRIARLLADMLQESGYRVVLTRDSDGPVSPEYEDSSVRAQLTRDLQARVDIANRAGADLFLSIHNNGHGAPSVRGTEVWFNKARPFSDRNRVLATLVLENLVAHLRAAGHPAINRGIQDDEHFRVRNGRSLNIYVLGPSTTRQPTEMPGVLGESLFVSNPLEAAALQDPDIQWAIARGYHDAVVAYFEEFPE